MNTVGMCFIYCGMAFFGYQSYSVAATFLVAGVGVIGAVHGSRWLADRVFASLDRNGPASAST